MKQTEEQFERRKKVIHDMLCDKQYVPMKLKEMAMLLQIPKENRQELKDVLDALILEKGGEGGGICKWKISQIYCEICCRAFYRASAWIWICGGGGPRGGYFYRGRTYWRCAA